MRLKKSVLSVLFIIAASNSFSQRVIGDWNGKLKAGTVELRVVFHVSKSGEAYSGTMDSPDQGAKGIVLSSVKYQNDTLFMELRNAQIKYTGFFSTDSAISGVFSQGGQSFPLDLTRQTGTPQAIRRPQEPVKPYPYSSEDVRFTNTRDHIDLAGTLTLPNKEGHFPAVVLITGSGPQNRDEEILDHKPFLIISDYLTRHGIAVLRFDDRGTAESQGIFNTATTLDFSYDAEAAVKYLQSRKEINKSRIGLIGHSEGGLIAPMIAARSKDVAFIVLLAGPGLRGDSLLLLQQTLIGRVSGVPDSNLHKLSQINRGAFNIILNVTDSSQLKKDLQTYMDAVLKSNAGAGLPEGVNETDYIDKQIKLLFSPWMQYFLRYDPAPALKQVKCPVLAIGGDKDLQVPAEIDLSLIKKYLSESGNKNVMIKIIPGLNHLFQNAQTGSPAEYGKIEETFSPVALGVIGDWILSRFSL
jgi:pimeloyl-ACP methyl ester carboxylesterase